MSILVFDTETTGLLQYGRSLTEGTQPRMVQLGAVLYATDRSEMSSIDILIKPDGWVSTEGAVNAHGISQRRCELYGVRVHAALALFMDFCRAARVVAAFPIDFDSKIVEIEMLKIGGLPTPWTRPGLTKVDIQQPASDLLNNGKRIKLVDAHEALFGEKFERHHHGLSDARAAGRIMWDLADRGFMEAINAA